MRLGKFDSDIQRRAVDFLRRNPWQQFGQAHDDAVWGGATACTHTVWQKIIGFMKGRMYSLNEINAFAGMAHNAKDPDGNPRGMRSYEAERLIINTNLHYEVVFDKPFSFLLERAKLGPVMYAMRYGSAPEWEGARYNGVRASAPFALSGGKTQLTGFEDGRHAVVLAARRERLSDTGRAKTVARRANLRNSPNAGNTVVQSVPKGTTLVVIAKVTGRKWAVGGKSGTSWYKVRRVGQSRDLYVATALVGRVTYPVVGHVIYRQEPNHGSPVRRETPPFDIITEAQAEKEYKDYHDRLKMRLYAAVPREN